MEFNFYLKKYILVTFWRKWPVFAKSEIIRLRVSLCIHSEDLCENNQKVLNLSHFTASCLSTSLVSIPDYKKKRKRSKNWVQMFCVLYYKLEGATAYELTNFSVTHRRIRLVLQTWHLLGDRGPSWWDSTQVQNTGCRLRSSPPCSESLKRPSSARARLSSLKWLPSVWPSQIVSPGVQIIYLGRITSYTRYQNKLLLYW